MILIELLALNTTPKTKLLGYSQFFKKMGFCKHGRVFWRNKSYVTTKNERQLKFTGKNREELPKCVYVWSVPWKKISWRLTRRFAMPARFHRLIDDDLPVWTRYHWPYFDQCLPTPCFWILTKALSLSDTYCYPFYGSPTSTVSVATRQCVIEEFGRLVACRMNGGWRVVGEFGLFYAKSERKHTYM